jgi:stearoyl-CoA desaturase (delta-9 desaturase)
MAQELIGFLDTGLFDLKIWQIALIFLFLTQITIFTVTIYLHRCEAHRGLDLHPVVKHFFRFWSWFTTGMVTREWVAIHRKHHACCETPEDPHSPVAHGIGKVLFHGVQLYTDAAKDKAMVEKYSHGCPKDWIELNLYQKHWYLGPTLLLFAYVAAFGVIGITFWALHILWIPVNAAGVINGLGHWWGYRNFATDDMSHNLIPWAVAIGGEELHNNHHAFPSSAKFSLRSWEFDIGWMMIRTLRGLRLATIRRVAPQLAHDSGRSQVDRDALRAIFVHRFTVMSDYCRNVIVPVLREESARAGASMSKMKGRARKLMTGDRRFFDQRKIERLDALLEENRMLETVYAYRLRLQAIWDRSTTDPDALLKALKDWCREAEATGIRALQDFSRSLATYRLQAQAI